MSKGKNKGIYKRGNVYWICYSSLDGRIIRESSKSRKFKDAEDLLIQRRQSVRDGKLPEIKKIKNYTFRELSVDYIKWCERQRGFEQKKNVIRQLVSEFGNYTLRSFNTKILEQYQTEKLKKIKPSTINRHVSTIKHMFTKSVDWEMVEEDVLKRIRKVKKLDENNKRLRYLTKEQCQLLVDSCDIHLRPIVVTGLNTGMRKSEILNLRWDQVDLRVKVNIFPYSYGHIKLAVSLLFG
jgi:integrase